MSTPVKIVVLCNNPLALMATREFLFYGSLAAVVVTKRNKEMQGLMGDLLKETEIPLVIVTRHDYKAQLEELLRSQPVTAVVMLTFPYIIPPSLLSIPEKGFINFHFGLLPQVRGPQPILWHLLNNDPEAGITVHKVNEGIDTGEIIIQEKIKIEDEDTYGALQGKLAFLAAKPAVNLLKILSYGKMIPSYPQDETKARYYEMPTARHLTINWQQAGAAEIIRLVNACNPWNKGAGTQIDNWFFGITAASIVEGDVPVDVPPGTILVADETSGVLIKTCDNKLIKPEIIYSTDGFYLGINLIKFGIKAGMRFR